jgi:uncharacterized protein YjbJ (UPF0337 family)
MSAETSIKGNWHELKGNVQKQWGKLTDDDITQINGDTEILVGRIMKAYSKSKEEAQKEVDRFCKAA